jgi:hypothetical protein
LRISDKPDLRRHKKLLLSSVGITLRYSDAMPEKSCQVKVSNKLNKTNKILASVPYSITEVEKYRI